MFGNISYRVIAPFNTIIQQQKGFFLGSISDLCINFDTTPRDFAFFKKQISPNDGFL